MGRSPAVKFRQGAISLIRFPGLFARQIAGVLFSGAVGGKFFVALAAGALIALGFLSPSLLHHLVQILLGIQQRAAIQFASYLVVHTLEKRLEVVLSHALTCAGVFF